MAIIVVSPNLKQYQGLSSDTKPSSVAEGSTFHVVDTGEVYIYHNGAWEIDLRLIAALRAV